VRAIRPCHDLPPSGIDSLEEQLYEHNRDATGHQDGRGLAFEAVDSADARIAAIAGYSWAGMAEIRQLWVDKAHRSLGLGRALVEAAVAEAVTRGCRLVWVATHSFQAPWLYEKCGFLRVADLPDWPPGHSKIFLHRRLATPVS